MARYYYHLTNYHHRSRHIKHVKFMVFAVVFMVFVAVIVIAFDLLSLREASSPPASPQSSLVEQAPITIFRTEFFQFQAGSKWVAIATASKEGKYVYRNLDHTSIQQELNIYVNKTPDELTATYVVPVIASLEGHITASELSPHCKNGLPANAKLNPTSITYQKTTFNCIPDGTDYRVLASMEGGTPILKLKRPNGSEASYILYFHDVTVNPSPDQFRQILNSFQTR